MANPGSDGCNVACASKMTSKPTATHGALSTPPSRLADEDAMRAADRADAIQVIEEATVPAWSSGRLVPGCLARVDPSSVRSGVWRLPQMQATG